MSNKPKNVKRLVEYIPNKAERRHTALVREAKKQGYKHSGSKHISSLKRIIPAKLISKFTNLFKKFTRENM